MRCGPRSGVQRESNHNQYRKMPTKISYREGHKTRRIERGGGRRGGYEGVRQEV